MVLFLKTSTETKTIKKLKLTSNMAYVNEKVFDNYNTLYIVEMVRKSSLQ